MADHLIVLDFFGLPGCGKSVCSHELAEMLKKEGFIVDEISYNMDHHHASWKRYLLKSFYAFLYTMNNSKEVAQIDGQIFKCCDSSSSCVKSLRRNVLYKLYLLKKEKASIAIMDEGIAQAALSLTVGTAVPADKVFTLLVQYLGNMVYIPISLETTIDTALAYMSERVSNDSRVEKMKSHAEKVSFMLSFQNKINQISREKTIQVNVDENQVPGEIASKIKQQLDSWKIM